MVRVFGGEARGAYDAVRRDGSRFTVEVMGRRLPYQGRPARVVAFRDVTERRRAEESLREAYEREREAAERLRDVDEMKNAFLTAVSHELRTPLASILGFALTLDRDESVALEIGEPAIGAYPNAPDPVLKQRLSTDIRQAVVFSENVRLAALPSSQMFGRTYPDAAICGREHGLGVIAGWTLCQ